MMDGALGMGNSIVQINAELDFRQVERNLEQFDSENPTIRSEQTTEEKTILRDSLPPSTRSNSVTNYEISKTVEHIIENVGNIKRLSVAAIVNDKAVTKEVDGVKNVEYKGRTPEEMDRLTEIVKSSVGFNPSRNDDISVVNMPFDTMNEQLLVTDEQSPQQWNDIAVKVILVLAMGAAIFIIRSLLNRLKFKVIEPEDVVWGNKISGELGQGTPQSKKIHLPSMEDEVPIEVALKTERRIQIQEYVKKQPDEASRLIKVWLSEEV